MTGRFGNGKKALEFLRDNDVDWIDANNVVSDIVKDICEQVAYGTLTPEGLRINFSKMCKMCIRDSFKGSHHGMVDIIVSVLAVASHTVEIFNGA